MSDKSEEVAIKVQNVSKDFKFDSSRAGTLKSMFTGIFKGSGSKSVKKQHALKKVSFEVKKGEFFGIVGRNGSGKSTLLKMMAGIYQPTKGNIEVNGRLVPFIELGVGFNPELTGKENVYLNGALLNFSEKEIDKFYNEVVEFAELEDFMDKQLKNYSSGMQVRLAFSMAIRAKADTLLIDEVLAVGDADFQRKCFGYFNLLKKTKTTVVFVSHDMEAVRQYCDRAIMIEDGKALTAGSVEKIAQAYIKQFNQPENFQLPEENEENRWGDGKVTIDDFDVRVNEAEINFKQTIKAHKDTDGVIAGIRIKNSAGDHITGTNTKLQREIIDGLKKGQSLVIEWKMPNVLADGSYQIDSALTYPDEITVYDWREEFVDFDVVKTRRLPYSVDPGFNLTVHREK